MEKFRLVNPNVFHFFFLSLVNLRNYEAFVDFYFILSVDMRGTTKVTHFLTEICCGFIECYRE